MTLANSFAQLILAKRVQQKLKTNPNDVDSLVTLASLVQDDPALKRTIVDRILTLEPANKTARHMLLELDQAEMFNGSIQTLPAVPIVQEQTGISGPSVKPPLEKPLVFKYEILARLLVYAMLAFSLLPVFALAAADALEGLVCFGIPVLLLLIPCWAVSARVELNNSSLKFTRMFGLFRREIEWNDVESIQFYDTGAGMKVTSRHGRTIRISSNMTLFPVMTETLSRMRPDLYNSAEAKIYRKGFFWKYIWFAILIPCTLLLLGSALVPPFFHSILIGLVLLSWWKTALFGVHSIQLEGNKLAAKSFCKKVELTAGQITGIHVCITRNLKGVPKKWVRVEDSKGKEILLSNFPEGIEALCSSLQNWWLQHRTT